MRWKDILDRALEDRRTLLCVGLDTDMTRFGGEDTDAEPSQFDINREIIEATSKYAAAYKLNMAFYEVEGEQGIKDLKKTVDLIKEKHPGILVILDAKKGDIGNTSKAYARAAYSHLDVDSVTLNGYMGRDAVDPFSEDPDRLCFVLCRTSNRAASEVQDHGGDKKMFIHMAELIRSWNGNDNLGMVVGATFPEELAQVREIVGHNMPILVPGVGAQGGDLEKVLRFGTDERGGNILINVSRGIMFAYAKDEYKGMKMAEAAEKAAKDYYNSIRKVLEKIGRW